MSRRVRASDVAAAAGVSRSAVSRAFTPGAHVAEETRERVLLAAKALGYRPNALARTLVNGGRGSGTVAVVMGEFDNPFQPHLFAELARQLAARGKIAMLVTPEPAGGIAAGLATVSAHQVEGAVIAAGSLSVAATDACLDLGVPAVLLGREDPAGVTGSVLTDNEAAGRVAAGRLLAGGCRRIAFVGGRRDGQATVERERGFRAALDAAGLAAAATRYGGDYSYAAGFHALSSLRADGVCPDGVVCASDALACGLLDAAVKARGLAVPGSLRVVGCDDVPMAAWPGYRLTTVRQPVPELVARALDLLDDEATDRLRLAPELVARETA